MAALTPDDICAIYYARHKAGLWKEVGNRLVQKELQRQCWQAVLDAVRTENQAEVERLKSEISAYQAVVIQSMESAAA